MREGRHLKILRHLFNIAQEVPPVASARIAAAVVYKGEIVSVGINKKKSHPLAAKYCKTPDACFLHAEVSAIKNALKQEGASILKKSTLYICRAKHASNDPDDWCWGLARPCKGCLKAILDFDLRGVVFSAEGSEAFAMF